MVGLNSGRYRGVRGSIKIIRYANDTLPLCTYDWNVGLSCKWQWCCKTKCSQYHVSTQESPFWHSCNARRVCNARRRKQTWPLLSKRAPHSCEKVRQLENHTQGVRCFLLGGTSLLSAAKWSWRNVKPLKAMQFSPVRVLLVGAQQIGAKHIFEYFLIFSDRNSFYSQLRPLTDICPCCWFIFSCNARETLANTTVEILHLWNNRHILKPLLTSLGVSSHTLRLLKITASIENKK